VLFSDIDDFKAFNDRYSYAVGDRVLRTVADCLKGNLREVDILARFGGDEFVILLPETRQEDAINVAERLRSAINALTVETNHSAVSITLSFGLAERLESDVSWDHLLERASTALRRAKQDDLPLVVADAH
jgi:diguanylate cyclase